MKNEMAKKKNKEVKIDSKAQEKKKHKYDKYTIKQMVCKKCGNGSKTLYKDKAQKDTYFCENHKFLREEK